jgi:hypothetical protein
VVVRWRPGHRHRFTVRVGTERRPYAERVVYGCAYPGCMKMKTGKWEKKVPPK